MAKRVAGFSGKNDPFNPPFAYMVWLFACGFAVLCLPTIGVAQDENAPRDCKLHISDNWENKDSSPPQHFSYTASISAPGLPSTIQFNPRDAVVVDYARALLVLDGKMLAVPLRKEDGENVFAGEFPSPRAQLDVQLQTVLKGGNRLLSPGFSHQLSCPAAEGRASLDYPRQEELVEEARSLERQSGVLSYIIRAVSSLVGSE